MVTCYSIMRPILLFFLLLGEFFLISSGQGVIYCVKLNSTATCSTEDHCDQCQTLQYYFDNANTTINQKTNVTMLFMDGDHIANFSDFVLTICLSAQTLNLIGKGKPTVTLIGACQNNYIRLSIAGSLTISSTHFSMKNFNMMSKSGCRYLEEIDIF